MVFVIFCNYKWVYVILQFLIEYNWPVKGIIKNINQNYYLNEKTITSPLTNSNIKEQLNHRDLFLQTNLKTFHYLYKNVDNFFIMTRKNDTQLTCKNWKPYKM